VTTSADLAFPSGATEVLPNDAPRDVWLAERRNSIGGSDASTLVDLNPYGSRMQLWMDKTGQLPDRAQTTAMEWGVLLEPVVRGWVARTYELDVRPAGMLRRPGAPRAHANPDGVALDQHGHPDAGLEIKTSSSRSAWQWRDGQVPDHAELQAQLCMWVTGLRRWWVVGLIDGRDPQVRLVHADLALGQMLADAAARFYADHVEPRVPPAVDDSTATADAIRSALARPVDGKTVELTPALAELFRAHGAACAGVQAAEAAKRKAESALRMALGDAALVVDDLGLAADRKPEHGGRTVYATADANGTFSTKAFAAAEPDLAAEFTHDAPQLDVAALKAAHPDVYRAHCARPIRTRRTLADLLHNPKEMP
jgi:putative phage-type endonuclease